MLRSAALSKGDQKLTVILAIIACCVFVGVLLHAEARGASALRWFAKPAASACFVVAALAGGALATAYGQWILAGLCLCAVGDVLLIARRQGFFLAGMGAFTLGHCAYVVAFLSSSAATPLLLAMSLAATALFVGAILRSLWPHLGALRGPVAGYCVIIALMVASSPFAAPAGEPLRPMILAGAIGFAVSDIAVARDQFIKRNLANRLWGLPLYYASQLLLAASLRGGAPAIVAP